MKQGAKLVVDPDAVGVALCVPGSLWHTVARFFRFFVKSREVITATPVLSDSYMSQTTLGQGWDSVGQTETKRDR